MSNNPKYLPLSHYVKILIKLKMTVSLDVTHCGLLPTLQVEEAATSLHSAASQKMLILSVTVLRTKNVT
jgi:hypothetical protein